MRVLNCMWSAETAYHSVHLVLSNFLDAIAPVSHESLFLMGENTQQKIFSNAQSFRSNKKSTKKLIARYFLRKKFIKKIQSFKPQLIVLDGLGMARLLLPVLKSFNFDLSTVLVYFHGETHFKKQDVKLFNTEYNFKLRLIAVSKTLAENLIEQVGSLDVIAIPTYLNMPKVERQLVNEKNTVTFAAVGRLVESKNLSILIECIGCLVQKGLNVYLRIAGDGDLYSTLQDEILNKKLDKNITLEGKVIRIEEFYQSVDVVLIPSLQEGQGLVIQEALYFDKPVVCSDIAVFKEQLGVAGIYCSTSCVKDWVEACEKLLQASERINLLKKQQHVHQEYNNKELFIQRCQAVCN